MPVDYEGGYQEPKKDPSSIGKRFKGFSDSVMQFGTSAVSWLTTESAVPDLHLERLAPMMSEATDWVNQMDFFGGAPGAFSGLRARITQISDPGVRAQAESFAASLQRLSPEEQSLAQAVLQGAAPQRELTRGSTPVPDLEGVFGDFFEPGAATISDEGALTLAGENASIDRMAMLKALFPQLAVEIGDDLYAGQGYDEVLNYISNVNTLAPGLDPSTGSLLADTADLLYSNPYTAYLTDLFVTNRGVQGAGASFQAIREGRVSERTGAAMAFTSILMAPAGIGFRVAGDIGRSNPVTRGVTESIDEEIKTNVELQAFNETFQHFATLGLDPSDPNYESQVAERMALLAILAPVGGVGLSRFGSAIRTARSIPGDTALVKQIMASQRGFKKRTGPLGAIAELYRVPTRTALKGIDDFAARYARDPEQFFMEGINGRQGRKLLDVLALAKRAHPDDVDGASGFVRETYGTQLPDRMVRSMLRAETREAAKRVFIDTLQNPGGVKVIRALKKQLQAVEQRLAKGDNDAAETANLELEARNLRWRLNTTFDDTPMLRYPSQSVVRAIVRQPTTPFQRSMHAIFVKNATILDPAKLVDELPRIPHVFVPGRADNPTDWLDQNTHVLSNYLRRAGVPPQELQKALGKLNAQTTRTGFYNVLEKEVFGDAGVISKHLKKSVDPDIRDRIINLHDTAIENRTRSVLRDFSEDPISTTRRAVDRFVLGKDIGDGVEVPLPSRPTEQLRGVRLPDVDRLIDADSVIRRSIRKVEMMGGPGNVAMKAAWRMPMAMMRFATAVLKPAVMIVRLPAMALRIQMEQGLRASQFGYRPFALPDGISLLPGGIPVPFTNHKALGRLFGEDGWRLLDPDPDNAGLSNAYDNSHVGMFLDEAFTEHGKERVTEGTAELRIGRRTPKKQHFEAGRDALEVSAGDKLDTQIARHVLNEGEESGTSAVDQTLVWLDDDIWAKEYMRGQDELLRESTLHPRNEQREQALAIIERNTQQVADVEGPGSQAAAGQRQLARLNQLIDATPAAHLTNLDGGVIRYQKPGSNKIIYLSKREGRVVGFRTTLRKPDGTQYQTDLTFVDPDLQGQGIGSALQDAHIKDAGVDSVDKFLAYLNDNEFTPDGAALNRKTVKRFFGEDDAAQIGISRRKWVENRVELMRQQTGGDPDMVEAISTGSLRVARGDGVDTDVDTDGAPIELAYSNAINDVTNLNAEIRERVRSGALIGTAEQRAEMIALQDARLGAIRRRREIERDHPNAAQPEKIKLADKRKFRAELQRRWRENPDTIPPILHVEKKRASSHNDGGLNDDMQGVGAGISAALYRKMRPLTYIDKHGTRGSLFSQAQRKINAELRVRGYDAQTASAIAYTRAGALTRDLMYDLNARTSTQRALKDIFWFAPATQEVLYTWLVKIPSQSYLPVGLVGLASKYVITKQLLETVGVVQKDANGDDVIVVPFVGDLIGALTHTKVPDIVYGKLSGLNLVTTGGGVPGLSTPANFVLGKAALEFGGVFKEISDVFQPYGPEATVLPAPITYLHEAVFGSPPPWEFLAPAYVKAQWDRSYDIGVQYAFADMKARGIKPPRPEDYGTYDKATEKWTLSQEQETAYKKASALFITDLMAEGKDYARGVAWTRLLGSTVAPMSLYTTSTEREDWTEFWNSVVVPEGFGSQGLSDSQHELIDGFLSDHPNSIAFSVFYSKYGRKVRDLPFNESLDDAYYDAYYTGEKETMEAFEFSQKVMASEARRFYLAKQDAVLRKISPTNDPWELLTGGFRRNTALQQNREAYDRWLFLNPEADAILKVQTARWATAENKPQQSYNAHVVSETIFNLKAIAPMLSGEESIRPDYLRETQANLAAMFSEAGEFGKPRTKVTRTMAWWYDNVLSPYIERTAPLWEQAEHLTNLGLNASAVYNEIRMVSNSLPRAYKGQPTPRVEEVFYGNKGPEERAATRLSWASRPITWLSDFQRETVGYDVSEASADFLDTMSKFDEDFWNHINITGVSPSSTEYDNLIAQRKQVLLAAATAAGPEALRLFGLSEAAPYVRIAETGFGADVPIWGEAASAAGYIALSLQAQELSPKGFSQEAIDFKRWLYTTIEQARDNDTAFDDLMTKLSYSFSMPNGGYREGTVLYEAVFFGNFNEQYIPYEIAVLGA